MFYVNLIAMHLYVALCILLLSFCLLKNHLVFTLVVLHLAEGLDMSQGMMSSIIIITIEFCQVCVWKGWTFVVVVDTCAFLFICLRIIIIVSLTFSFIVLNFVCFGAQYDYSILYHGIRLVSHASWVVEDSSFLSHFYALALHTVIHSGSAGFSQGLLLQIVCIYTCMVYTHYIRTNAQCIGKLLHMCSCMTLHHQPKTVQL